MFIQATRTIQYQCRNTARHNISTLNSEQILAQPMVHCYVYFLKIAAAPEEVSGSIPKVIVHMFAQVVAHDYVFIFSANTV